MPNHVKKQPIKSMRMITREQTAFLRLKDVDSILSDSRGISKALDEMNVKVPAKPVVITRAMYRRSCQSHQGSGQTAPKRAAEPVEGPSKKVAMSRAAPLGNKESVPNRQVQPSVLRRIPVRKPITTRSTSLLRPSTSAQVPTTPTKQMHITHFYKPCSEQQKQSVGTWTHKRSNWTSATRDMQVQTDPEMQVEAQKETQMEPQMEDVKDDGVLHKMCDFFNDLLF